MDIHGSKKIAFSKDSFVQMMHGMTRFNPHRDWAVLIVATLLLAVSVIAWQYHLFQQIEKGEAFVVERTIPKNSSLFNKAEIEAVGEQVKARDTRFANLKKTAPAIIDPAQ